jgi:hypothetical protein
MDTNRPIVTTMVVMYGVVHVYGGAEVPAKPLTLMIQTMASNTASTATWAHSMPDMMSSKDKSFDVRPPVDVRRPGAARDGAS